MPAFNCIVLTLVFEQEGDVWTGQCKELGTAAFGDTIEEARDILSNLVTLHLNSLEELGQCEEFLKERNVAILTEESRKRKIADVPIQVNVPLGSFITKNRFRIPAFC